MAIKIPRKSKKQRVNRKTGFADVDWTGWEKWDGVKFHRTKHRAIEDYYTLTSPKDNHQYTWTWMLANGYDKNDIRQNEMNEVFKTTNSPASGSSKDLYLRGFIGELKHFSEANLDYSKDNLEVSKIVEDILSLI